MDYYEILQISPKAEPDTIHRVYRLLAQRFHPDNKETGNEAKFRELTDAYQVLCDPERRAQYDIGYNQHCRDRWKIAADAAGPDYDFRAEQITRLTLLELLYTRRRTEPHAPSIAFFDLEDLTGRPREHLEFSIWFLTQKHLVQRSDGAALTITAEGVEYLEQNFEPGIAAKLLRAHNE